MTTTDIDRLEGLELRRRVLTLLGWEPLREASDGTVYRAPLGYQSMAPHVESSLDAFLEHAVPFIEERGWTMSEFRETSKSRAPFGYLVIIDGRGESYSNSDHPATVRCRALLKAAEAQG